MIASDCRSFLLSALKRVEGGGDITERELDDAIPNPLSLEPVERLAWEQLSHWADDADIRARDARYAAHKRALMRDHIAALSGYLHDEIERGEHDAWFMGRWGCGAMAVLATGAAYILMR